MAIVKYPKTAVEKLSAAVRTFSSCGTATSLGKCAVNWIRVTADDRANIVSSISLAFPLSS